MIRSLYSGVSGLQAHGTAIDVVADNIANVNAPGFKSARAQFQALVAQTLRAASTQENGDQNPMQAGLGVTVGAIQRQMGQGSPQSTGRTSDLAIEGNGFFVIHTGDLQSYTRSGALDINGERVLVEAGMGTPVLGWTTDAAGNVDTSQPAAELVIPSAGDVVARATRKLSLAGNLDAEAAAGTAATTSVRIFDSQGSPHVVDFTMTRMAGGTWSWAATDEAGASVGTGTLDFDGDGECTTPPQTVSMPLTNGATTPLVFAADFGMQQLAGASSVVVTSQDGLAPGAFQGFTVTDGGILVGAYSNGLARELGQIALATFTNPAGLQRNSSGSFSETVSSGPAQVGAPGSGGRGKVVAGALEMSNVDLTREFASLIVFQRGFQANGRSVTTSDQLLQEILALKQ